MIICLLAVLSIISQPDEVNCLLDGLESNQLFWRQVFDTYDGDALHCAEYIFLNITDEDRASMDLLTLEDHVLGALESRDMLWDGLPDSIFLPYLLQPRIASESITPYRSFLSQRWSTIMENAERTDSFEVVSEWMSDFLYDPEPLVTDLNRSPEFTMECGEGSIRDIWILKGASLRALGFPVRPVMAWFTYESVPSLWVDVWIDNSWLMPVQDSNLVLAVEYPQETPVTSRYVPSGMLRTMPVDDLYLPGWRVSLRVAGLDTTNIDGFEIDPFSIQETSLSEGSYILEVSLQRSTGSTDSWQTGFEIQRDSTVTIMLSDAMYGLTVLPTP